MIIKTIHDGHSIEFTTHKIASASNGELVKLTRIDTKDPITTRFFWMNEAQLKVLYTEIGRLLSEL